jgi:hypothetical protein
MLQLETPSLSCVETSMQPKVMPLYTWQLASHTKPWLIKNIQLSARDIDLLGWSTQPGIEAARGIPRPGR